MEQTQRNRCHHKWYQRKPQPPKNCPKCKSPYWNKERKEIELTRLQEMQTLLTK